MAGRSNKYGGRSDSEKSSPTASVGPAVEETAKAGDEKPAEKQETEIYHTVGNLRRGGETIPDGELIELTADEAKELGKLVAPGEPPPKKRETTKRGAGQYRVSGPGSVLSGGEFKRPGTELTLSEEDARSLGDAVEPI